MSKDQVGRHPFLMPRIYNNRGEDAAPTMKAHYILQTNKYSDRRMGTHQSWRIAPGMAQASLSTGSRSHLLPASRDDGQEVRVKSGLVAALT
jgi:hypothetical protein